MKSGKPGKGTSAVEVTNVSEHGFWVLLAAGEMFLPFDAFPWFREATIGQLQNVVLLHADHLYWPDLDVDLAIESIAHPERYPLVSKVRSEGPRRPAGAEQVSEKPRSPRRSTRR